MVFLPHGLPTVLAAFVNLYRNDVKVYIHGIGNFRGGSFDLAESLCSLQP
jgi:hypothetical protein